MKKRSNSLLAFICLLLGVYFGVGIQFSNAQETEKNKVRIKADYVKIMDSISYLDIAATARINKVNTKVSDIELKIINETEADEVELGSVITNSKGESQFIIKDLNSIEADSSNTYNLKVSFDGNESFIKAKRNVSFRNAGIEANIIEKDSLNFVSAKLKDVSADSLLVEESLTVQVQRLINPLKIGEEFNLTDDNGTILVLIEAGIPGVNGNLNIEVVLEDHDDYGTVKRILKAPVGVPIVEESTFDQRTMWSPRNKTPWFILIFTNLLIISVWGIIVYLIINLFKIKKS